MRRKEPRGRQGRVMRFLLRMAFWLSLVLVLLPSGGSQPVPEARKSAPSRRCRPPGPPSPTCGSSASASRTPAPSARRPRSRFGQRAQAGAKMLYEFLNEQLGPPETGSAVTTGSASVPLPAARALAGHVDARRSRAGLARPACRSANRAGLISRSVRLDPQPGPDLRARTAPARGIALRQARMLAPI